MKRLELPGSTLEVSEICLGSVGFGATIAPPDAYALMDRFLELGGNVLDSANVYSDWIPGEKSRSEKTIGRWMKDRGNRDQIIISTKGAHPRLETMHISRLAPKDIVHDLEQSLASLQTDWIDLYWLHRDDPARSVQEILETLNLQVKAGKIRYFGASNWTYQRFKMAQDYARDHGIQGFVADQVMWNVAVVDPENLADKTCVVMSKALEDYHRSTGIATMPYTAQANGLFQRMLDGSLEQMNPELRRPYPLTPNLERFLNIQQIMRQSNLSLTQVVLGYLLSQPFTTVPIIGPRTIAQLEDSLSAAGVRLSNLQLEVLA
jgi:aryl-alcohol dehydrogenase-like predicted oxidoreductase